MDPVFRFYAGPNHEQAGGRAGSSSRSIPVYEGYGFLSSLANRLFYPVLRNAGRDLLQRGLTYLADPSGGDSGNARKRGAGFETGLESEPGPPKKRRRKRAQKSISKTGRGKASRKGRQVGSGTRQKAGRKRKRGVKKRVKASASKNLFSLFNKK